MCVIFSTVDFFDCTFSMCGSKKLVELIEGLGSSKDWAAKLAGSPTPGVERTPTEEQRAKWRAKFLAAKASKMTKRKNITPESKKKRRKMRKQESSSDSESSSSSSSSSSSTVGR